MNSSIRGRPIATQTRVALQTLKLSNFQSSTCNCLQLPGPSQPQPQPQPQPQQIYPFHSPDMKDYCSKLCTIVALKWKSGGEEKWRRGFGGWLGGRRTAKLCDIKILTLKAWLFPNASMKVVRDSLWSRSKPSSATQNPSVSRLLRKDTPQPLSLITHRSRYCPSPLENHLSPQKVKSRILRRKCGRNSTSLCSRQHKPLRRRSCG
jgi:hypothetical protein